ncbi:lipase family protein [Nocardia terpenica]|uniref:Fungal lipase-type domain-containing protein n=1 Tax=Nocardia terpenica TaxID=455432 RepID=A0A6G9Z7N7_9NOCA|nr:hypothetical protein [Nocardia terpenica]QIS21625.1 hypothetical protein F6W96_28095 [Nocardia terpenica]
MTTTSSRPDPNPLRDMVIGAREGERERPPDPVMTASVLLAEAAVEARRASATISAGLFSLCTPASVANPVAAGKAALGTLRALTVGKLGYAPCGGLAGEALRAAGVLGRRRPLSVRLALESFRTRLQAAIVENPNLDTADMHKLISSIGSVNPIVPALALRSMVARLGITRTLTMLAPVSIELLGMGGLLDFNPWNDDVAWVVLLGGTPHTDPVVGLPVGLLSLLNRGRGRAYRVEPDPILRIAIQRNQANDIVCYVNNIAAMGNHGLVLLRRIRCRDNVVRHVLMLPGTSFARLSNATPQDVVSCFDSLVHTDTTYTRSVGKLLADAAVPEGSEMMLVGHSLGGITAINLAADPVVAALYRLTHVVTVGSPIDNKRTADPATKVVTLVNEHDVIPCLDGRGPACPVSLPESWSEFSWRDETYDFPLSHAPQTYSATLLGKVPEIREQTNALITLYDGEVLADWLYAVRDN